MATPGFPGFPPEAMEFFRALKKNNKREWFQKRKHIYEEKVLAPMVDLVTAFNRRLVRFAPEYVNEPRRAIYRIYRDTRFSKDKTPYKTHIAAVFPHQGLGKHNCGGFYFGIDPDELEVAGGLYMPGPEQLRAVRDHIAASSKEFERLVSNKTLRGLMGSLWGDQLSRVPKGYAPEHPAAAYLRYKQWIFYTTSLPPKLATTPELLEEIVKRAKVMTQFVEFLNRPLKKMAAKRVDLSEFLV
jgi:uncharacterized protein (TIGR02453 family)